MSAPAGRLIRAVVVTAILAAAWSAADAQQWKIYTLGRVDPILADFYVEDTPWILFHDDQSMYVFAIGCNRVERVERDGVALPPPACPIERLPTSMPRVYVAIMDLEAKRLDDAVAKLREQTRAYAEAVLGSLAATRGLAQPGGPDVGVRQIEVTRAATAIGFLQTQIGDTLSDIRLIDLRVGKLLDAAKTFPPSEKQRFFFAPR
jgi:hypothetical protein